MIKEFEAKLQRPEGVGTWMYIDVPFNVQEVFGGKTQVKVKGTINNIPYRSTLMPGGDGSHYMVVNQSIRDAAGVTCGADLSVTMELDTEARNVTVPPDLQSALEQSNAAKAFEAFSYSHKKEYIEWIENAKKAETRSNRIEKAVAKILEGKNLK